MEPKTTRVSGFFVSGLAVRTMNCDELNQKTAKTPGLWVQFFSGGIADKTPDRLPDTPIFGVYSTYESDATGSYNVTAGGAHTHQLLSHHPQIRQSEQGCLLSDVFRQAMKARFRIAKLALDHAKRMFICALTVGSSK
ncbi:GyrI-like domain-containing protein [Pseudomonas yamanorum]